MYKRKDSFYFKAKKEGYLSRSAYKLIQLNKDYKLIKKGDNVVDVGCAPGGWMQVIGNIIGDKGKVIGIDRLSVAKLDQSNTVFIQGDIEDEEMQERILNEIGFANAVMSDASPNLTGIRFTDEVRSLDLCKTVFHFAKRVMRDNGNILIKVFPSADFEVFLKEFKKNFAVVKRTRPEATRKSSSEIYLIGKGFKK